MNISDTIQILQVFRFLSWKQKSLEFVTFLTEVLGNMEPGLEITKTANFQDYSRNWSFIGNGNEFLSAEKLH